MRPPIRLLIVDDHLVVREGLRLILETDPGIEVIGEASDGVAALRLAEETAPDVVLMDLRMPGMDGLEALARLRRTRPAVAVVILTTYNEDDLLLRALRAGARGYLLKDTDRATLFNAIRAAARGETLLQPEVLARALAASNQPGPTSAARRPLELSDRERAVLAGVARGERSKEIAARLGISERTVKAHLAGVFNKLGVDSRAAAVAVALQRGLLPPGAG
ncbi:MAG TPA: response regulator transcription factor [Chloroflexia bacterium]|nr:response regulator transcription factor [Chloroflexia bacterium]